MSDRELLQKALEAIIETGNLLDVEIPASAYESINEIRSALEQPDDPVAWMGKKGKVVFFSIEKPKQHSEWYPLYTHPQPIKTLTEEQIMDLTVGKVNPLGGIYASSIIEFARDIEKAHGIT